MVADALKGKDRARKAPAHGSRSDEAQGARPMFARAWRNAALSVLSAQKLSAQKMGTNTPLESLGCYTACSGSPNCGG